jgi:hypothetical protein
MADGWARKIPVRRPESTMTDETTFTLTLDPDRRDRFVAEADATPRSKPRSRGRCWKPTIRGRGACRIGRYARAWNSSATRGAHVEARACSTARTSDHDTIVPRIAPSILYDAAMPCFGEGPSC